LKANKSFNFPIFLDQKLWMKTLKQHLLSITQGVIVRQLIMLMAKDNDDPKWLSTMEKLAIENSMTKKITTKKLTIENLMTKKCGDGKFGN